MKCKICGSDNFVLSSDKLVCRNCLEYKYPIIKKESKIIKNASYNIDYALTKEQKEISSKIIESIDRGENVLVNAVCGAGKTEIIYDSIIEGLRKGKRVGIAIPRKDVVEELYQRLKKDLVNTSIIRVYGGQTTCLEADVIIFTTHQGYRYIDCFDLLFIDEVDAFPYKGNKVLNSILNKCCKGPIIYLSATISKMKGASTLVLNRRYHGFPIPVPNIVISYRLRKKILQIISKLIFSKIIIIFVGSIKEGEKLFCFLKQRYEKVVFVHSTIKNRDDIIRQIKKYQFKIVVSTTILERGITLEDVQIIVYKANNKVFDVSTLLQIVGRAGRKANYHNGKVYFLSNCHCEKFQKVIKKIKRSNE